MGMEQGNYIDEAILLNGGGGGGGGEEIPFAPYEQSWEIEPPELLLDSIATLEPELIPFAPYEQSWEIEPPNLWEFPEGDFFGLPYVDVKTGPCNTPDGFPKACIGAYWYRSTTDPCECEYFPPSPPKPPTQQTQQQQQTPNPLTKNLVPASKPPAQTPTACPTGYCKHPTTGQCLPIPQGWARHPQTQVCTPIAQQAAPLPVPTDEDAFADLKKLPWWVWAAGVGLVLLSRSR